MSYYKNLGSIVYISSGGQQINHSNASPLLRDGILDGGDAVLICEAGQEDVVLDWAASCLAGQRIRILRTAEVLPDSLRIPIPSLQPAGPSKASIPDDEFLIQSYNALTVLDQTCDRIVLLISDAHALQQPALRYIQFMSRSSAHLQLIFCGTRNFLDILESEEFAWLQARLMAGLVVTLATPSVRVSTASPSVSVVSHVPAIPAGETETSRPGVRRRHAFVAGMSSRNPRLAGLALFGLGGAAWLMLCMQSSPTSRLMTSWRASTQPTVAPRTPVIHGFASQATPVTGGPTPNAPVPHPPARSGSAGNDNPASSPSMRSASPSSVASGSLATVLPQTRTPLDVPDSAKSPLPGPMSESAGQGVPVPPSHTVEAGAIELPTVLKADTLSAQAKQMPDAHASRSASRAPHVSTVPLSAKTSNASARVLPPTRSGLLRSASNEATRPKSVLASDVGQDAAPAVLSSIAGTARSNRAIRIRQSERLPVQLPADDQWLAPQPVSASSDASPRYIGSYAIDANGVRRFHTGP